MKSSKHNAIFFGVIVAGLAFLTSLEAPGETEAHLSAQDEDAFILYKYSLMDAKKGRSPKISKSTEGGETIYKYDGHALSCRTVMTGSITKTTLDDRAHVVGVFDVSNNSYGITQLSFDFYEGGKRTRTGTMTVNGKMIDMKHFNHR